MLFPVEQVENRTIRYGLQQRTVNLSGTKSSHSTYNGPGLRSEGQISKTRMLRPSTGLRTISHFLQYPFHWISKPFLHWQYIWFLQLWEIFSLFVLLAHSKSFSNWPLAVTDLVVSLVKQVIVISTDTLPKRSVTFANVSKRLIFDKSRLHHFSRTQADRPQYPFLCLCFSSCTIRFHCSLHASPKGCKQGCRCVRGLLFAKGCEALWNQFLAYFSDD